MRFFGKDFQTLDDKHIRELMTLEREQAIYTDHWIEKLKDFRHVRIRFKKPEVDEYVRRMWAYELFRRAGSPELATSVKGIDADIAQDADRYAMPTKDGKAIHPWHCIAGFLGSHLESLVCTNLRHEILEEQGQELLLSVVKRAIDSLTPVIRLFSKREKRLQNWAVTSEDDVRDLLYAMLRPAVDDLIREDPVPSKAGSFRIVDLASSVSGLFIEIKW